MPTDDDTTPLSGLTAPSMSRPVALAIVTLLLAGPVIAAIVATAAGWVAFNLAVSATVNAGHVIEWLLLLYAALLGLVATAAVVRVVGLGFTRSLARIAHNYSLPEEEDQQ